MTDKKAEQAEKAEKALRKAIKQIDTLQVEYGNLDFSRPLAEQLAAREPATREENNE
jgi:hypothetical protein